MIKKDDSIKHVELAEGPSKESQVFEDQPEEKDATDEKV